MYNIVYLLGILFVMNDQPRATSKDFYTGSQIKFKWFVENIATNPRRLAVLSVAIPITALIIEPFFDTAFGRSGSVLVCIAILSVYINHFLNQEKYVLTKKLEIMSSVGDNPESYFKAMPQNFPEKLKNKIAEEALSSMNNDRSHRCSHTLD